MTELQQLAVSWSSWQQAERSPAAWIWPLGVVTKARPQLQPAVSTVSTG